MKKFPVALQLYSVRKEMAEDFCGTLKKVKKLGYDGVEFAGLFGKNASEVKGMCSELGLIPVSAHVPYVEMADNPDVLEVYAQIGCEYVAIPCVSTAYCVGNEKFDEFLETTKMLCTKAKELGMKFCYHNHDFEFKKIDGEYGLDIIYNEIPKELLETELDTCWINVGGENPSDYIRKYKDRTNIIHLKDFVGTKSENMYALIGIDETEKKNTEKFEYRPVGYGVQNFKDILKAAEDVDAKWVVVEQDNPSPGKTALECAKMSIDYLNKLE